MTILRYVCRSVVFITILGGLLCIACDENLPPRIVPNQILTISDVVATQGTNAGGNIIVNILITGQNSYDETFQDTVNVRGFVHIWWLDHPDVQATLALKNSNIIKPTRLQGRIITIDPAEKFFLQANWNLLLDDGRYLMQLLEFSAPSSNGRMTAEPAKLKIEVELSIFPGIGYMRFNPIEFTLHAWKQVVIP